jgi:hypothetical protein
MAFVIYSARPPTNPCDVSVSWPESIPTLEAALSRVLDAMSAAIQHGAMREEYCIKTTEGSVVLNTEAIKKAYNNRATKRQ